MHEIGTHVIDIRISENTAIIYSNDLKITWNQVTISLCALRSASRLAQQSKTLPVMPSQPNCQRSNGPGIDTIYGPGRGVASQYLMVGHNINLTTHTRNTLTFM